MTADTSTGEVISSMCKTLAEVNSVKITSSAIGQFQNTLVEISGHKYLGNSDMSPANAGQNERNAPAGEGARDEGSNEEGGLIREVFTGPSGAIK